MKSHSTLLLFIVLAIAPFNVQSQEAIDSAYHRAAYEFKYSLHPDKKQDKTDIHYLDIGRKTSRAYSRKKEIRDSVRIALRKEGFLSYDIIDVIRKMEKGDRYSYTKHFERKEVTTCVDYDVSFFYDSPLGMPQWIISDEESEIAGYRCKKAEAKYLGRDWTVFFTPDIPISDGPWKLWGLPGLVVEAKESEGYFQFLLTGFQKFQTPHPIYKDKEAFYKGSNRVEKKKVTAKEYKIAERIFNENYYVYMVKVLGDRISAPDLEERMKRKHKYVLIEPQ